VGNVKKSFFKKAASKKNAQEGEGKLDLAIQAGLRRDYAGAVSILEELISEYEAPPGAYLLLGRSFHGIKQYAKALAAFNDYLRFRPRSAEGYFFMGRTYLAMGMPHRAVPSLRKALALDPADPLTMSLLGMGYLKSKHSQMAVDILRQAVETPRYGRLSPRERERIYRAYLNALLIRGIRLCRQENFHLGIEMLRFVLQNGLDLPLLRLELGRACRETGALDEALGHYSQALEYAPQDLRIRWYRASILMVLNRNIEAQEEIAAIRSLGGDLPDLPWNSRLVDQFMIRSFLATEDWRRAAESCRSWLRSGNQDPVVHAMYAEAQRNLKDYSSALNHLERAVKLEPNRIELWYETLLVAWEGRDWEKLRRAIRTLKTLGADQDLVRRFSVLYESATSGDDRRIIQALQKAIRALGPEPELMYALGERYLKIGLIDQAKNWFSKTKLLQKNHERSYLGEIAAIEALLAEGAAAGEDLKTAYTEYLARWPDNYLIRRERAVFLVHQGEFAEASKELEALLAWEPANPTLRRVLAYTYRKTGRYREAAVYLKALLKERPRNVGLLLEYSGCLARAGAIYYAVMVLEKAMDYVKGSPDIPMALGILFYREQKIERAFDLLREAAARNNDDPRPYLWMALIARNTGDAEGAAKYEFEAQRRKKAVPGSSPGAIYGGVSPE
jgi:tetratricopeptide (TPR) repeat protein